MRYVVPIYMLLISSYNLWGNNSNPLWVIFYFLVIHAVLATVFFYLSYKAIIKNERRIFFIGGVFSCFYLLFHVVALIGFTDKFLSIIDKEIWSIVFFVSTLLILTLFYCDKDTGNHSD